MSLRIRLALWYGGLIGGVVILVTILAYAIHVRTHYDQIDDTLEGATQHIVAEYEAANRTDSPADPFVVSVSPDVPARVYDANGDVIAETPSAWTAPRINLGTITENANVVPYDWLAQFVPISLYDVDLDRGSFSVVEDADGARWRVIVTPVPGRNEYVAALSSLDSIDDSITGIRWLLSSIAVGGVMITLAGGWVLAGRALRPVRTLTDTAGAIARLRTFGRRVPVTGGDELADMSATFNLMLDELEASYRMQQQFVGDASHELRAPLTTIQSDLEFLSRHRALDENERQEVIDEARAETNRLVRLVADLLALARADSGMALRREDVELDRLLLEGVRDARHQSGKQQVITITDIEPIEVVGDADRLKQLIIILLDNAVKYTPPGGSISVALQRAGGAAEVVIRDTGVGIGPDDLPRVFDRFYRADTGRARDPGGTGLGLSIANWIVEQHNGMIAIDSELGAGTAVRVRLPLNRQAFRPADQAPGA